MYDNFMNDEEIIGYVKAESELNAVEKMRLKERQNYLNDRT